MADPVAVSGSKFYIGQRVAKNANPELADFASAVWTEIKGAASYGAITVTQNWVTQGFIDDAFDYQFKGSKTGSSMDNQYVYDATDPGQNILREAINDCSDYQFKFEAGAGCAPSGVATITIASPGVVTVAEGHGLAVNAPVVFSTTGSLPTGLVAGTTYYVIAAGFTATTFQLASTPGGTAIVTTGTQSGIHTVTGQPVGLTILFHGNAGEGTVNNGENNTSQLMTYPVMVNSNLVRI